MKKEFEFTSSTGKRIMARIWLQEENTIYKGIVQLVHGMQEHIDRYDAFAEFLLENGYLVVGHDHLGHGKTAKTEEELGFFAEKDGWNRLAEDVHILQNKMNKEYPELPYFIFGHSMGSLVVRTYLTKYQDKISGAILQGTSGQKYGLNFGIGLIEVLKKMKGNAYRSELIESLIVGGFNKQINPHKTTVDWITRDEEAVQIYLQDKRCGFNFTLQAYEDLLRGSKYLSKQKNVNRTVKIPILLLSGDRDPVGGNGKGVIRVYEMLQKTGNSKVEIQLYKDARHDLLNEINSDQIFWKIWSWIEEIVKES